MKHDLRAMVDAIGYLTRYGIEWRALPVDFPPWEAVYAFFERWSERGLPQRSSTPRPCAVPTPWQPTAPALMRGRKPRGVRETLPLTASDSC